MQRSIEEAGISTICLSNIAELTASVGAPRVAAIEHPGSQPLGPPGDTIRQLEVLTAALKTLEQIETPGTIVDLPFTWPKSARHSKPKVPPPIAKLIMKKPWLLPKLIYGKI
ncbi:MAG: hypothetical protein GY847_18780 [Proteobacteria bacterium]|nr:hypothetical protein [Pseudomonadota bacterium]